MHQEAYNLEVWLQVLFSTSIYYHHLECSITIYQGCKSGLVKKSETLQLMPKL